MSNLKVAFTLHGECRSFARIGLKSEEEVSNYATRAWNKGKTTSDFSGRTQSKLLEIETSHNNNTVLRVFAGFCFIFNKDAVLITVYKVNPKILQTNRSRAPYVRGDDYFDASDNEARLKQKKMKTGQILSCFFISVCCIIITITDNKK